MNRDGIFTKAGPKLLGPKAVLAFWYWVVLHQYCYLHKLPSDLEVDHELLAYIQVGNMEFCSTKQTVDDEIDQCDFRS